MRFRRALALALVAAGLTQASATAQNAQPITAPERPAGVAATVNGQPILEVAVHRRLRTVPATEQATARGEIINYLVDLVLIDQYLVGQKLVVDPSEVETHLGNFQKDLKDAGQDYAKFLANLLITEAELRQEIAAELRWEKFLAKQVTDEALQKMFTTTMEMFDGSKVRARHILLTPDAKDAAAVQQAQATLKAIKAQVEAEAAGVVAKLPETADALQKEQARCKKMDELFAQAARDKSSCPSKRDGGDLGKFHRAGSMVEPFAKAAFALKPFEVSEVVPTQFGYHLIMVTAREPGQPTKFEEVKEAVKETYEVRLKDAMSAQLRARSKIEVSPAPVVK